MLPSIFIAHGGGPAHVLDYTGKRFAFMDKNSPSKTFLSSLSSLIKENTQSTAMPLQCILIISAHWEEPTFTVDYQTGATKLIYDYYGFPEEAYAPNFTYPVKTHLPIADRIFTLLEQANIPVVKEDHGFDHGIFCPMNIIYPDPNEVPVVQLSLKEGLSMEEHIKVGEVLRPLRSEGVLILGSGSTTHNLPEIRLQEAYNAENPDPRVKVFWIICMISLPIQPQKLMKPRKPNFNRLRSSHLILSIIIRLLNTYTFSRCIWCIFHSTIFNW